jgi:hypothetical protein
VLREVGRLGDRLSADLDRMEMDGDRKLSDRVTELVGARRAFEERVARLTEQVGTLETIRADIGGLLARLSGVLEAHRVDGGTVRTGISSRRDRIFACSRCNPPTIGPPGITGLFLLVGG